MTWDWFHLLQEFLHFNGKANSSYDPMMGKEAVVTTFTFCIWNFVINFTVVKSSWVFANYLRYLNVNFISSSIYKKRVCFEIKFYKLTSSNGTTLFFSVNSRKSMFHNGNENSDMSPPERNPFHQLFLFKLLKITINTKTGLLMYVYFLLLWFIFWQIGISIPIWLSLWI